MVLSQNDSETNRFLVIESITRLKVKEGKGNKVINKKYLLGCKWNCNRGRYRESDGGKKINEGRLSRCGDL